MGNSQYKTLDYLCYYIETDDSQNVEKMLLEDISLLETSFRPLGTLNGLVLAVWRGNLEITKIFVKLGADVNVSVNNGHRPVFWCAIRDRLNILKFLVEDAEADIFLSDAQGFTPLDQAIINGNYEVARYLKNKGLRLKSLDFYNLECEKFFDWEVDFENVLQHLHEDKETCEDIFMKSEQKTQLFEDPVIDPRESWGNWTHRIINFEPPPLVERSLLPEEWRPENRGILPKMNNYLHKSTLLSESTLKEEEDEKNEEGEGEQNKDEEGGGKENENSENMNNSGIKN